MTKRPKVEGESRVESEDWPTLFTMVPEWITFAAITDRAHRIYTVFAAHLRRDTGSRVTGVITQADLAAVVGLASNPERVRRYVTELEDLGAVRVIEEWDAVRKIPITRYVVRFNPPADYVGHIRIQTWQDERRTARKTRITERQEKEARRKGKDAGHPVTLKNAGHETRNSDGHETRKNAGPSTDVPTPDETSSDDTAPSARSARGVRSTSSSGSGARGGSGSAASGKAGPSTGEAGQSGVPGQRGADGIELTREQLAAVHAVEAGLPGELELPFAHIPKRNRAAVLAALESRTPEQLAARAARRWVDWRYEVAFHDGELRSHIAVALELIAPTPYCPDLSCEDRFMIDTGEECVRCTQRIADRRAARLAGRPVPIGRASRKDAAPECVDCGRPFAGVAPADGVCKHCHDEAAAACAAFATQATGTDADREAEAAAAEALEQEAQRRRALREAEAALVVEGVDQEQAAGEAEEDRRLQAEILAANPWMAQHARPETVAALQGPAPF